MTQLTPDEAHDLSEEANAELEAYCIHMCDTFNCEPKDIGPTIT